MVALARLTAIAAPWLLKAATLPNGASLTQVETTPITRVVNLLKNMQKTIEKEMADDEALYQKLSCWCNTNEYEKGTSAETSTSKIDQLEANIDALAARSNKLTLEIKSLEDEVAADKNALATATEIREKQQKEFHGSEVDSIQALESIKAALTVLSKHHVGTPAPWGQGEDSFGKPSDSWSLLAVGINEPGASQRFLQQTGELQLAYDEEQVLRKAMKAATAFAQAHGGETYFPSYNSQSGEIVGVLQQLKDEMEADLSESQKTEQVRAAQFAELRAAKMTEIENGESMAEKKEDMLATTKNDLAEAREDLGQEKSSLDETQRFLANLQTTCGEADKNFAARKQARADESKAVSETITILTKDEARDAFTNTFSFVQIISSAAATDDRMSRKKAAATLRRAAAAARDPQLSMLASAVELDAFSKVKKAIDDMVAMLKIQQDDEVKKRDWCTAEFHETEVATAKSTDLKEDLQAKHANLESNIGELEQGLQDAKASIAELQVNLQRATEDRHAENLEFQKAVADQTMTIAALNTALDRLDDYYKQASMLQSKSHRQTPPVPQAEYAPNSGSLGVMQMIQKIVQETRAMTVTAKKAENEAQAAYEQTIADTNASVRGLQQEITTKTKEKARATKDKLETGSDISDTDKELEGMSKYTAELHGECDFVLKNFDVRQEARAQEIEALQQAKQVLSGASLS
jgi:hypothetical protein